MKATILAAASAVLAGGVSAARHNHRHVHEELFRRGYNESETCVPGCTTIWSTITGPAGLYTPPATATPTTTPVAPTTSQAPATVPTPVAQTCPTPGTYTFPATTVVVTETTTVCAASTTAVPTGTHTLGGVTTVVTTATTVVCPYATTETKSGVVTSVIKTTTYVCPEAGTYTIAPITTTVTGKATTVVVPVVTTYCPGTYTAPAHVTTITETDVVVYCPFTAQALSSSTSSAPVAANTTTAVPTSSAAATTAAAAAASSSVSVSAANTTQSASASQSSASSSGGSPQLGGSDGKWAITYTPYTTTGDCKAADAVAQDIQAIAAAGFKSVRVYSTDCDTLPNVGAACKAAGIKMIIGIFIGEVGCDNASPHVADQIAAIKAWAKWDLVELVVVGNEAIFNNFCSVTELKDLIATVKTQLTSVGYSGPFTTTDVVSAWIGSGMTDICSVIDVVACNAHAYFNAATLPAAAGAFVAGQLALVEAICGFSKPGYVMETGWPTAGECYGEACAGQSEQAEALSSIKSAMGDKVVFFSFTDDEWKQPGACGCEQHWGAAKAFGA
ncbi:glycoside hydrolase [Diplogelasinospora grovesii]|uniref:Probable beta-glucosidase btgE n=1 Tax=Diplogelasinospora grovesii TaxID=303347 RepID=A0AAN6NGE3_9PEZI|nr:glycoside hydrolase [Diplogelasinospora grovesii]